MSILSGGLQKVYIIYLQLDSVAAETIVAEPQDPNSTQIEPEKKPEYNFETSKVISYIQNSFGRAPLHNYFSDSKSSTLSTTGRNISTDSFVSAASSFGNLQSENIFSIFESLEKATSQVFESCAQQISSHFILQNASDSIQVSEEAKNVKIKAVNGGCLIFLFSPNENHGTFTISQLLDV